MRVSRAAGRDLRACRCLLLPGAESFDLPAQVVLGVEPGAGDALLTELCLEFQQFSG